jgi:hypothetical protein
LSRALATECSPEAIEVSYPTGTADYAFAVEGDRFDPERHQRLGNPRRPIGMVVAAAGEHPHTVVVAAADEAIVLDLVDPLRTRRHGAGKGWKARRDEAGRVADGSGRAREHAAK